MNSRLETSKTVVSAAVGRKGVCPHRASSSELRLPHLTSAVVVDQLISCSSSRTTRPPEGENNAVTPLYESPLLGHLHGSVIKALTLDFGSGRDLAIHEFKPHIRLCAYSSVEPA